MRVQLIVFCSFLFVQSQAPAESMTVCEVLDHLSELNGKEVQIIGAWSRGDTGEDISASPLCDHPVTRDGWIWRNTLSVITGRTPEFAAVIREWQMLVDGHVPIKIMATLTGRIETTDHFKVRRSSHVPMGYGGYFVARLVCSKAEGLRAVPFTPEELSRIMEEGRYPWPAPINKRRR